MGVAVVTCGVFRVFVVFLGPCPCACVCNGMWAWAVRACASCAVFKCVCVRVYDRELCVWCAVGGVGRLACCVSCGVGCACGLCVGVCRCMAVGP
ncbi:hypothetical protein KI387_005981, partial [Taxus chinensis]